MNTYSTHTHTHNAEFLKKSIWIRRFCKVNLILIFVFYLNDAVCQNSLVQTFQGKQHVFMDGHWNYYDAGAEEFIQMDDSVISLRFNEGLSNSLIAQKETQYGLTLIRSNRLQIRDYSLNSDSIFQIVNLMSTDSAFKSVSLNYLMSLSSTPNPNDVSYVNQWHLNTIKAKEMWDFLYAHGSNCHPIVAVIDAQINFNHEDIGMGPDNYENVNLNTNEDAWTNPSLPSTGNAVDDDDIDADPNTFIDDWKGWDFYSNDNDTRANNGIPSAVDQDHGTWVAGILLAKTNNSIGISGVAGGWGMQGARLMGLKTNTEEFASSALVDDAIIYATDHNAKVINMSLSIGSIIINDVEIALKDAHEHGVILIASAGNDDKPNSNFITMYPANSKYCISVGASTQNNNRWWESRRAKDIMAPGYQIYTTATDLQGNSTYSAQDGTSFAAPIVSGTAANMTCVNECLTTEGVRDILYATAEKLPTTVTYNPYGIHPEGYNDFYGYGLINSFKAVQAAQKYYSATLDLYMKDCPYDLGGTGVDYACTTVADNSPDIWMRYYQDGIGTNGEINDEHEYVQYYGPNQAPNYVYVRIRNKSCVASTGNELLKVYWSKAATWGSWPQNWDGTIPTLGNSIATVTLPILQPGEIKVIEIPWVVDANVGVNGPVNTSTIVNYCILARIESLNDPISPANPNNLVESNNNIAIRNTFLWDLNNIGGSGPILGTSLNDGFDYPLGSFVAVENPLNNETVFDFHFKTPTPNNGNKITDDAEIILVLQQEMFDAIQNAGGFTQQGVQVIQNREVKITKDSVVFENVLIPENTRWINFIGVRYLIDSVSSPKQYTYLMAQSFPDSALYLGGENIIIRRNMRTQFNASAGPDVSIFAGDSVTISASGIGEPAKYQWFDANNNLLHNTQSFTTSVNNQTTFKLRVTSQLDGSVDYDAMNVFIKNGNISTYYPNPITNNLTVDYTLEHVNTASLVLLSPLSNIYASFPLNINSSSTIVDFSNYPSGFYSLLLMCDGNIQEAITIQKL